MIHPSCFNPAEPSPGDQGYLYSIELKRAIKVALATQRPLLLRGEPGVGKSRLAQAIASDLDAEFFSEVVTSRTEARDLQWTFDTMQRLCDAQAGGLLADRVAVLGNYVKRRALWSAFERGHDKAAVVLIDEIDKAEPHVANDLLETFDGRGFTVAETNERVSQERDVLLVVTTNAEKDLPAAFLRRCIAFRIELPDAPTLVRIGRVHFDETAASDDILERLAALTVRLQTSARAQKVRAPATAEFLDAVRAARALPEEDWAAVAQLALWKHEDAPQTSASS